MVPRALLPLLVAAVQHVTAAPPRGAASGGWTCAAQERFLREARIESNEPAGKGLTGSRKLMLSDGRRTHAAHFQSIDIYLPLFKAKDGSEEKDFRDSWKFNVAAWRVAKMLGLDSMVPVCVQRTVDGKPGALDWWIDDILMDERERKSRGIRPPDIARWNTQMDTIRVFDQLIYNVDRSEENLLIGRDWRVWMIDHSRSFRPWPSLRNPAAITHATPELLQRLKALDRRDLEREIGGLVTPAEIDGLLARRDLIVERLQARAAVR